METKRVLVKEGDAVIITCPFCRKTDQLSVIQYRKAGKRELNIKCTCEEVFCAYLEFRKHPRKFARLLGRVVNNSKHRENQDVIIKNISLGGIGFTPLRRIQVRNEDRLQVSFYLDDLQHTPVDARVTVRNADAGYVGCEFDDTEGFKTPLGFYLLS